MPEDAVRLSLMARLRVWAAPAILQVQDFCRDCIEDIPLLTRIASHVGLLALMVLTIAASSIQFTNGESIAKAEATDEESPYDPSFLTAEMTNNSFLSFAPIPITNIPKRIRRDIVKYTVQPGDSVSEIAEQFEISADSILWANPKLEDNPEMLSIGQVLNIPPVSGVLYTVQSGDTLKKIADKFKTKKTSAEALIQNIVNFEFNKEQHDLTAPDYQLAVGQYLMVPGGYKPYTPRVIVAYSGPIPANAPRGTGHFGWPVTGRLTQKFWSRHLGIDVGAPKGTPVYAADSGYVTVAGWDNERISYGYMILINHGNGYITRYAHLSAMNVEVGNAVKKGQLIGRVGSTGNSTGPHLHFEIIAAGRGALNPFSFLR